MIEVRQGNVLNVERGIVVHGTNCLGYMGGGVALEIKNRFPEVYSEYRRVFQSSRDIEGYNGLKLGNISFVEVSPFKLIINANTQQSTGTHKRQVSYDAIQECFEKVTQLAYKIERESLVKLDIVFPAIGAGLGGGNWNIISSIIDETVPDHFNKILYKFNG